MPQWNKPLVPKEKKEAGTYSSAEDSISTKQMEAQAGIKQPKPLTDAEKKAQKQAQNEKDVTSAVSAALKPEESQLQALPQEYQQAMAGFNAPGSTTSQTPSTGNAAMDQAIAATNLAASAGQTGVQNALGKEGAAGQALEANIPHGDVLSSMLTAQKNALLYGTTPTYGVSKTAWSGGLKNIYNYIEGMGSGNAAAPAAGSPGGGPTVPTPVTQGASNPNAIPGSSGASSGYAG